MAVLGRVLIASQERIDLPDLLAVDGFTSADFKAIVSSFTGDKSYIVKGLDVINPAACISASSLSIKVSDCLIFAPTSPSGPFFQGLPEGHELSEPLIPNLIAGATNYVYAVLATQTTASDQRAFWDPDSTDEWGSETVQEVDTQTILTINIGVSTSSFPEGTIPICKVQMSNVITSITDCRNLYFRLGTGGQSPDTLNQLLLTPESPITISASGGNNPFQGGDKDISSMKQFMDIVMTRLKEISGDIFWYDSSSPMSIKKLWWHSLASTLKSRGEWVHDQSIAGKLSWTADINILSLIDKRNTILRKGDVTLQDGQVAFLELKQDYPINGTSLQVEFVSGANFINANFDTTFDNLSVGDWIKSITDSDDKYVRVEGFYLEKNLGGGLTSKDSARSIKVSSVYAGLTATNFAVFTRGEYTSADIMVTNRDVEGLTAMGEKFFWIATRDDNKNSIANIETFTITATNLIESSGKLICTSTLHGLIDGDWITVSEGAYSGTYQVEVENGDIFSIESIKHGDSFTAYFGLITTGPLFSEGGFQLEDEFHRFAPSSQVVLEIAGNLPVRKNVNVRGDNLLQTHLPSEVIIPGETIYQPRITVKRDFGAIKIVQGSATEVENETDLEALMSFIGMKNINESNPTYHTPSSYNTLIGRQSFNTSDSDSLTERLSKLTSMMADRVQDRSFTIKGRSVLRNVKNGANQVIYSSQPLELIFPSSPTQAITVGAFQLPEFSVGYAIVNRNNPTSQSISVEEISTFSIDENKIILFYRLGTEEIYLWNGTTILSGSSAITDSFEDSGSKNIYMVNSGKTHFDIGTGKITLEKFESEEVSKVVTVAASEIPPNCYFTFYEANDLVGYYVWPNVQGISTDPLLPGMVGIEVYLLSADNANTVAAKIVAALQVVNRFDLTRYNNELLIRNRELGPATDIADGSTPTPFDLYVVQQGSRFNVDLIVSGYNVKNTVDATSLNDSELLILRNGYSAWVYVSKTEDKVFDNISTDISTIDTGTVYITKTSEVPAGQDIFVLWSNVNERIVQVHNAAYVEDNIYEEHIVPETRIPIGSIIDLPKDSLDNNQIQFYLVGASMLQIYLNGNLIIKGVHWEEVGTPGFLGTSIRNLIDIETYDRISFRLESKGSVYFTAPSEFQTDPFLRPSLNSAYNTGNVISVINDRPVSLYGDSSRTLLEVAGNASFKVVSNTANQLLNNTTSQLSGFGSEIVMGTMTIKDAHVTKTLKDLLTNPLTTNEDILIQRDGIPNRLPIGPEGKFFVVKNSKLDWTDIQWSTLTSLEGSSLHDLESRYHSDLFNAGLRTHAEIDAHLASNLAHGITTGFVDLEATQTLKNKSVEGLSVSGGTQKASNHLWSDSSYLNLAGSSKGFKFHGTAGIVVPKGTELDRPSAPEIGTLRYNTQFSLPEFFNGQEWELQRSATIVETPSIITPSAQGTVAELTVLIEGSTYYNIYNRPHTQTDWQVATDIQFNDIVFESLNNTVNLVSITTTELVVNSVYYVRVRYKDNLSNASYWSFPSEFLVATNFVNRPEITTPTFGSVVEVPVDVVGSAFSSTAADTHIISQVQVALDSLFLNSIYDSGEIASTETFQIPRLELNPNTTYWIRIRYKGQLFGWSFWSIAEKFITSPEFKYAIVNDTNLVNPYNLTGYQLFTIDSTLYSFGSVVAEPREYIRKYSLDLTTNLSAFSRVTNDISNDLNAISRSIIISSICELYHDTVNSQTIIMQRSSDFNPIRAKKFDTIGFEPSFLLGKNGFVNLFATDATSVTFVKFAEPDSANTFDAKFQDIPPTFTFLNDYSILGVKIDNSGNYIMYCKNSLNEPFMVAVSNEFATTKMWKLGGEPTKVLFEVLNNDYVMLAVSYLDSSQNYIETFSSGLQNKIQAKRLTIGGAFTEWDGITAIDNGVILSSMGAVSFVSSSGVPSVTKKWNGISSPVTTAVSDSQIILKSGKSILVLDRAKLGPIGEFPEKPYSIEEITLGYEGYTSATESAPDLLDSFLQPSASTVSMIASIESVEVELTNVEAVDSKDEF